MKPHKALITVFKKHHILDFMMLSFLKRYQDQITEMFNIEKSM